jgi:hypothetical protein
MSGLLFATGIENSIPTAACSRARMDELDRCDHYRHWETDFALVREPRISFLLYGPPLQSVCLQVPTVMPDTPQPTAPAPANTQ